MKPTTDDSGHEQHQYDDVDTFTAGLDRAFRDADKAGRAPLFRGHGMADWKLLPTAWRKSELGKFHEGAPVGVEDGACEAAQDADAFWRYEVEVIARFVEQLMLRGIAADTDLANAWSAFHTNGFLDEERVNTAANAKVPQGTTQSVLALARHYGVPTRLLDWTTDWRMAAYFAACDALKHSAPASLCVWQLDLPAGRSSITLEASRDKVAQTLERIRPLSAHNRRMQAQRGEFTLLLRGPVRSLECAITEARKNGVEGASSVALRAFALPATQARALLSEIKLHGIDGGLLFPDVEGALRATKEISQRNAARIVKS